MPDLTLEELAFAAADGDRDAAARVVEALQDEVYRLALRMLGHPQDAEDASQEILVVVLTNLGAFRGGSALRTWVFRIAVNHLLKTRLGRRERVTFETIDAMLDGGLRAAPVALAAETAVFEREVRLHCTEALLLALERDDRVAFILGDVFGLDGAEAASALDLSPPTYRKRLSRARARLLGFLRARCGVFDGRNACRCSRQVGPALAAGLLQPDELPFALHPVRGESRDLARSAAELDELLRVAEVLRHPAYAAPARLAERLRALLDSDRFGLLGGGEGSP